jgi:hypothetical protein
MASLGGPVLLERTPRKCEDDVGADDADEQNENVAFFISDMTTMSHQHRGEDCVPKFKPEDIEKSPDDVVNTALRMIEGKNNLHQNIIMNLQKLPTKLEF